MIKPLEIAHVDTCLSCYWSGSATAHVQIPVWRGMTMREIKAAIYQELCDGAVMGSNDLAWLLSAEYVGPAREKDAEEATKRAHAALNRMKPNVKGQRKFFMDLEEATDDSETVYAFFYIQEK